MKGMKRVFLFAVIVILHLTEVTTTEVAYSSEF